jgi:hypothetical protein
MRNCINFYNKTRLVQRGRGGEEERGRGGEGKRLAIYQKGATKAGFSHQSSVTS